MEISGNKTYVFTSECDVVAIKSNKDYITGQQLTFSSKDICIEVKLPRISFSKGFIAAAAVFILMLSTLLYTVITNGSFLLFEKKPVALISVDINPSIELRVNKNGKIVDAVYGNDEGKKILEALDYKNKPVEEEISKIISLAKERGYIAEGKTEVLVTGALYPGTQSSSGSFEEKLKGILDSLEKDKEADVIALYINDPEIISDAEGKDVSIGKLALYQYAQSNNIQLSLEEIKTGNISELFDKLKADAKDYSLAPSESAEPKDSAINTDSFAANVSVAEGDGKLIVKWNKAPSENGFSFYKVVASASNSSPAYPEDGYALVISDISATEAALNSGCEYHGGDVGGVLSGGKAYYISVTYVYDNTKIRGNAVRATMPIITQEQPKPTEKPAVYTPAPTPAPSSFYPNLSVSSSNTEMYFSWTPIGASSIQYNGTSYSDFQYYKVVASQTNPSPVYPKDGYLYYSSDESSSDWSVDVSGKSYNQSPKLESGKTYYFSITYVFKNGKFSSSTVQYKVPEYSIPTAVPTQTVPTQPSAALSVSSSGTTMSFSWSKVAASSVTYGGTTYKNFNYYKIVASQTNPNPVYPKDGYLYYSSDKSTTDWSVDVTGKSYNQSPKLESGKTYYFSITYVFDNGKFSSNTVQYKVP